MDPFKLPKRDYEAGDLVPYIDETTMLIHYENHHATYVKNLKKVSICSSSLMRNNCLMCTDDWTL